VILDCALGAAQDFRDSAFAAARSSHAQHLLRQRKLPRISLETQTD